MAAASQNFRAWAAAGLLAVAADQISKAYVLERASADPGAAVFSFLDGALSVTPTRSLTLAFGFLADWPAAWQAGSLAVTALLIAAVALFFYRGLATWERLNAIALGLLVGGGLGNLADWFLRGAVIEIVQLGAPAEVPWSRFNLADGFIVLGIFLLAAELLVAEGASRVRTRPLDRFEE